MSKLNIEAAGPEDYEQMIVIWEKSVRATHHFLSETDILAYRELILNEYFDQVELFSLKLEDEIKGFIGLNGQAIQMLFIHPEARGDGFGTLLIDFAKTTHGANTVDVNEQNIQAIGFYEKLGFTAFDRTEVDAAGKPFPILSMAINN